MTTKKPPNAATTAGNLGLTRSANPAPSPKLIPPKPAAPPSTSAATPRRTDGKTNKQRPDPFFRRIFDLVRDFLADDALQQRDRVLNHYIKPDLTIIDDMGLRALPKHSGEYLLEVIMRRYETRSTIMTSNRPLEDWGKLLQDVPTAGAVLDRFLHHATVVSITGESYRLKDASLAKSKPKES